MDEQALENDPWRDAEARYQPGQEVRGTVTRVTQFGIFARVEPGIEGIVYAFELGAGPAAVAGFAPGQEIHLYVKSVDTGKRRLELGLGQQAVPGLLEERAIPAALRRSKPPAEPSWPPPLAVPDAPAQLTERTCPTCQRQVQASWKYCVYCGGSLQRHCTICGSVQPDLPDARYCCECGKLLA